MAGDKNEYILSINGMSKSFGRNKVLKHISLNVKPGSIMGLMGENGAGKSTMMKCLFGTYQKDEGTIVLDGKEVNFSGPKDALENGVAMVHQELNQCLERNVIDNLFLGRYPKNSLGVVDEGRMKKEASDLFRKLGITVNLTQPMKKMSVSQRQLCEIAKASSYNSKVIVLDEPTSSLTAPEVAKLFKMMRQLKEQGISLIYISHKMDEIFRISDTITVLRDGQWIGTKPAKEAGVNVVIVNQRISDPEAADCYVGADAATTGSKLMEEVMKDIDGKGNVALLLGPMGSDGQVGRSEGFDQVLADYPDVTVAFQDTAEWQTEPALTIVENWLNAGKEISAVVAQNDSMAVGAAKAIADAQKTGEIKVYGIDATSEGLQAVLDGKLQGTMAQGTADQGKFAADAYADLLDGKEVDSETIVDNVYYTADNAQEALDAIAK